MAARMNRYNFNADFHGRNTADTSGNYAWFRQRQGKKK
jgi:hypothetical protein